MGEAPSFIPLGPPVTLETARTGPGTGPGTGTGTGTGTIGYPVAANSIAQALGIGGPPPISSALMNYPG